MVLELPGGLFEQRDVRETPASTATATAVGLTDGKYVVIDYHADMTDERKLTAGTAIQVVDGGANSTVTLNNTGVTSAVSGTGVDVTGATGAVTFSSNDGEINHDALNNFAANEHRAWENSIAQNIHADNYTDKTALMGREDSGQTANAIKYYAIVGESSASQTAGANAYMVIPTAGTLQNFRTNLRANTVNGNTDIHVYVNGAQSGITVQYGSTGTGAQSDLSNTDAVVAGDLICIQIITAGGSGAINDLGWGLELAI